MALKKCKDCGKSVSKKAKTCPACGAPQAKTYRLGTVVAIVFLGWILYVISGADHSSTNTNKPSYTHSGSGECRQFIKLFSDSSVSHVNLWAKPTPQGKGRVVGKMIIGSKALWLETLEQDFKVKSLFDGSIGYVSHIQVTQTMRLNDKTFKACD